MTHSVINRYTVYVTTCDSHIHLIKPFQFLFNRFWSPEQQVVVVGYKPPEFELEPNFTFISLGEQVGGSKKWAEDLRGFFNSISDKQLIYMLEDMFLQRPVDFDLMEQVFKLATDDPLLGRIGFTSGISKRRHNVVRRYKDFDLITLHQQAQWRIAVQTSLWNKSFLTRYMRDGYSPWDYEVKGSKSSLNDGFNIYSTDRKFVVSQIQSVVRGDFTQLRLDGIDPAAVKEMKKRQLV